MQSPISYDAGGPPPIRPTAAISGLSADAGTCISPTLRTEPKCHLEQAANRRLSEPVGQEDRSPVQSGEQTGGDASLIPFVAAVLKLPVADLGEGSGMHNIRRWDSLRHIMLMMRIEQHYGIELSNREITEATSIVEIRRMLHARGLG